MISLAQLVTQVDASTPLRVPSNWLQGRTAYGGVTTALALQAALHAVPDLPPLRSGHVSFIAPAVEALTFRPEMLRRGKSVASMSVDVRSEDVLAARVALVFGQARASRIAHDFSERPPVEGPQAYPALTPEERRVGPVFAQNFDIRPAGGSRLMSGAAHPELLMWMKHVDAAGVDPTVALVALADGLPPAAYTSFTERAPISSVTWTFDLLQPDLKGEWFLLRAFSRHSSAGYSVQDMEIWDESGRSVLWGRQMIAIFT
ncbi:MAG: thioesterase family protein [Burkholderiaceae bacterium]|nr:MAG: thioesterase family protein [Burkholderiaceae bacterium]